MSFFCYYKKLDPDGSEIGKFAERYLTSDSNTSMIKQGMLLEYLLKQYLKAKGLYNTVPKQSNGTYVDLDDMLSFLKEDLIKINVNIYKIFDNIRNNRNDALQNYSENKVDASKTISVLKSFYEYIFAYLELKCPLLKSENDEKTQSTFTDIVKNSGLTVVNAFELAFKNALSIETPVSEGYEWVKILIDWGKAKGLATGEAKEKVLKRQEGGEFTFNEHIEGMVHSLLSNQVSWEKVIKPKLDKIDKIFHWYDKDFIKSKDGSYFEAEIRKILAGNKSIKVQMRDLYLNIKVLEDIEKEYGSIDKYFASKPSGEIIKAFAEKGDYKLHNMWISLSAEYVKNVGVDAVKPDVHLRRFFGKNRMGHETHRPATENEVFKICEDIKNKTGYLNVVIDEAIWNLCRDTEQQVCGAIPNCNICPIRKYCKLGLISASF